MNSERNLKLLQESLRRIPGFPQRSGHLEIMSRTAEHIDNQVAEKVNDYALQKQPLLKTLRLPSCKSVGNYGVQECAALETVELPLCESVGLYAFYNCTALTSLELPAATSMTNASGMGAHNFDGCSNLTTVRMPLVRNVSDRAFVGCTALETVEVPKAEYIAYGAFTECSALVSLDLPEVTSIDSRAFYDCGMLQRLDCSKLTTIAATNIFCGCTNLTELVIRTAGVCTVTNYSSASSIFGSNGPIIKGTGFIYVPRDYVDAYQTDAAWSTVAGQIRALEDYTEDGTVTGELTIPLRQLRLLFEWDGVVTEDMVVIPGDGYSYARVGDFVDLTGMETVPLVITHRDKDGDVISTVVNGQLTVQEDGASNVYFYVCSVPTDGYVIGDVTFEQAGTYALVAGDAITVTVTKFGVLE